MTWAATRPPGQRNTSARPAGPTRFTSRTCATSFYLYWPLRGLARSHRYITNLKGGDVPVGAGKPAKRPADTTQASA
ncbi:hypothetical protein C6A77_19565 [Pseudomonas sp. AFG_SD02_1510_Pfu_092]|nr:hypothetical protein C6A77_19565 [Pseudomonas sp. AFG_SD02_1510_Pfu_092]